MTPLTIALVDPLTTGHHSSAYRISLSLLLRAGHQVWALYPDTGALEAWVMQDLPALRDSLFTFKYLPGPRPSWKPGILSRLRRESLLLSRWFRLRQALRKAEKQLGHPPDLVFLLYADYFFQFTYRFTNKVLQAFFPYPWSGLWFQPKEHCNPGPNFRRLPLYLDNCVGIGILNENLVNSVRAYLKKPVILFPDTSLVDLPEKRSTLVSEIVERAAGRKIIGLVGSLDRRKGLVSLLKVSELSPDRPWFFVIAGKLVESSYPEQELKYIHKMIADEPENCYFSLNWIPEEPIFNEIIKTCDVLYAVYHQFMRSSGLMIKAASYETPVVVSEGTLMADRARRYRLGEVIRPGDLDQAVRALEKLAYLPANGGQLAPPLYQSFREAHSHARLQEAYDQLLKGLAR